MKSFLRILSAAALALGLALTCAPAGAQQPQLGKEPSPAAVAAAREVLVLKNAEAMYALAVPNIVEQSKNALMQTNINYQKDLNEVAVIIAQRLAGKQQEIGDGMAKIYASLFTEQELRDLVAFYKSPLGQKLLANEPRAVQTSMAYMNQWAQGFGDVVTGEFRSEMKKRGKTI